MRKHLKFKLMVPALALIAMIATLPHGAVFAENPKIDLATFQSRMISNSNEIKAADRKIASTLRKYNTALSTANDTIVDSTSLERAYKKYLTPMQSYNDYLEAQLAKMASVQGVKTDSLAVYYSLMDSDYKIIRQNKSILTFEKEVNKKKSEYKLGAVSKYELNKYSRQLLALKNELNALLRARIKIQAKANQKIGNPLTSQFDTITVDTSYTRVFDVASITTLASKFSKNVLTSKYSADEAQYKYSLQMSYEDNNTSELVDKHMAQLDTANEYASAYEMAKLTEELWVYSLNDDVLNAKDDMDIADLNVQMADSKYKGDVFQFTKGNLDSLTLQKSLDELEKTQDDFRLAQFKSYKAIKAFEYYTDTLSEVK